MRSNDFQSIDEARLFDRDGRRKYLCAPEGRRFLDAANQADRPTGTFGRLLACTGCRISEALAITPLQLDAEAGRVIFRTLKRRRASFRAVPVPAPLMNELLALAIGVDPKARLWPWCRQTGWRRIKRLMAEAEIHGPQASPKGLRHQFGLRNAENSIPPATTQRWMGHAKPQSTAIYQQAVGEEERTLARRLWPPGTR